MKVIVTARNGQLGWELERLLTGPAKEHCYSGIEAHFFDSSSLDVTNQKQIDAILHDIKPDVVINAAAYTKVDQAESEANIAYAVNESGVIHLARSCKSIGARLIHVSTDFIFGGSQNTPLEPADPKQPLGVYGASKLAGELRALEILGGQVSIVRTSWVYSVHGNNFVKTMIRLMQEKDQLGIVADQIGSPTSAKNLANALIKLVLADISTKDDKDINIFHWTDLGVASWYDFAIAIQDLAYQHGIIKRCIPISPIKTSEFPTPARRPSYSVMDTSVLRQHIDTVGIHWRQALNSMIQELK